MKLYIVSLEQSVVLCNVRSDERENKNFFVTCAFKTKKKAENYIQDTIDKFEKMCIDDSISYLNFTRYEYGCSWLDVHTFKDNWFLMERNQISYEITSLEI